MRYRCITHPNRIVFSISICPSKEKSPTVKIVKHHVRSYCLATQYKTLISVDLYETAEPRPPSTENPFEVLPHTFYCLAPKRCCEWHRSPCCRRQCVSPPLPPPATLSEVSKHLLLFGFLNGAVSGIAMLAVATCFRYRRLTSGGVTPRADDLNLIFPVQIHKSPSAGSWASSLEEFTRRPRVRCCETPTSTSRDSAWTRRYADRCRESLSVSPTRLLAP